MITPTILVVEDDQHAANEMQAHLEILGYNVASTPSGREAIELSNALRPDLIVLDISLSNGANPADRPIDGIEVLQRLRNPGDVPILMLSSTNVSSVKVMALSIGADDYVAKPCDFQELGARIGAILRRSRALAPVDNVLGFSRIRLDADQRKCWKDGARVELTTVEFNLIYTLARRPGHVFTRERLLQLAWKEIHFSVAKAIDVHIGHIRRKIEDNPLKPTLICTVRGAGYRFEDCPVPVV